MMLVFSHSKIYVLYFLTLIRKAEIELPGKLVRGLRHFALAAGTVICLSGCIGMDNAVQSLRGKNITVAVAKLGYPSEERDMLGHSIYSWKTGNPFGGGLYCNFDLVVDSSNKIENGSWEGNNGGCASLAGRLN
jgi:hypothetical protein